MRYLGLLLFWIGSVIRLVAAFALGHRFSGLVAIQQDHKLKTDGFYKHVRHPSYTGLLVAMIGWVLVFRSVIGLVLNVILFFLLLSRMADEEKFLQAEFGEEYRAYRQKTWRLFPFVY
jgi:protein-S-isoprenylcysteine O-methyltransferase Ste14